MFNFKLEASEHRALLLTKSMQSELGTGGWRPAKSLPSQTKDMEYVMKWWEGGTRYQTGT